MDPRMSSIVGRGAPVGSSSTAARVSCALDPGLGWNRPACSQPQARAASLRSSSEKSSKRMAGGCHAGGKPEETHVKKRLRCRRAGVP